MHVEWYGQSTFRLQAGGVTVVIDPFGDMSAAAPCFGNMSTKSKIVDILR